MNVGLDRALTRYRRSETVGPIVSAVVVGLLAGMSGYLLRILIDWAVWLFQEVPSRFGSPDFLPVWVGPWYMLVVPAIGMVLVVLITWDMPEARGTGVSEVQYAVRSTGGRLPFRLAVRKAVASAFSIGSGGTLGREGPIVQIGATLGSVVGQRLGVGADQIRLFIACGAAGGVGAVFNAPIAGVMFALEVVLGSFAARAFGLVVISSVTATALSRALVGEDPAFLIADDFSLVSYGEFGLYLILGIISGLVAATYVWLLKFSSERADSSGSGLIRRALLGGLTVGALGTLTGGLIFDAGHLGVELAMDGGLAVGFMLVMIAAKMLSTSITLFAGGSGGIFAPSLFIGAMLGGAYGQVAGRVLPWSIAPSGAYALVGMAAVFGAVTHAPISTILILFEMTGQYEIILPLLFCAVVAYLLASRISPDSAYSFRLRRRGALASTGEDWSILDLVLVADVMAEATETVSPEMPLSELEDLARHRRTRSWPVSADGESLAGIVTDTDLERALLADEGEAETVGDIMTHSVIVCSPDETIRHAFRRFTERDVQLIPVVEHADSSVLVGVLFRHDMLWAYREMSQEHDALLTRVGRKVRLDAQETVQVEYMVPADNRRVAYRQVREIRVPPHTLVVLVRRAERAEVPRGDTRVEPGDVLVLLTLRRYEDEIHSWLERG